MRTLYHYQFSPFSRRVRLSLAHKGLEATLREGRAEPEAAVEARKLVVFRTLPVLVDEGRAMGDSTAIAMWLDAAYPKAPRLFPDASDAHVGLQALAITDVALNTLVDLGSRYFVLRESAAWPGVKDEMVGRAQAAAEAVARVAAELPQATFSKAGWSYVDMAVFTMAAWIEGWPGRVTSSQNIAQLVTLGFNLPAALSRWADAHRKRADVVALG